MNTLKKLTLPVLTQKDSCLLAELSNACAVSGNEREVRKIVRREIEAIADSFEVDMLGSVIAVKKAKTADPVRILIAAHMDEAGFMLTDEEDPGIFRFMPVGKIDPRALAGKAVLVGPDRIPGVIGACPIHLTTPEERRRTLKISELRIDIGAENKSVKPGTFACFATRFAEWGPSFCGKALDGRLGICSLIRIFKDCPENVELTAAFTVQEEVGMRGAQVIAWDRRPDAVITIGGSAAGDLPKWNGEENTVYTSKLGGGPVIDTLNGITLSDPRLVRYFRDLSETCAIPSQISQAAGGGRDAVALHLTQEGIPVLSFSVPGRYPKTAAVIARRSDWEAHLQLLYAALANINKDLFTQAR